ncbi:MAG: hypothetical protein KDB00_26500 [Planctomycetales bacterium]|nr:hypothetical protein [Planctomycetales bacterium]
MKWLILTTLLIGAVGCTETTIETGSLAAGKPASSTESPETLPSEQILTIADGTRPEVQQQVKAYLSNFINDAAAGSVLHIVRSPDHKWVGTIVIPEGSVRARLRDKELRNALARINAMLTDSGVVPAEFRQQLSLDKLGATYWSLRQTDHPCRITLVGTPVYYDPKQLQWAFGDLPLDTVTRYPSDSSLTDLQSTLPHRRLGRKPIPADVQIAWLTDPNWGGDKRREDAVIRFYRHAFASQIGGELVRITSDPIAAFESEIISSFPELDQLSDEHPPRMITLGEQETPEQQTTTNSDNPPEPPPEVAKLFQQVAADPDQTLIAINWTSEYPETDLDLWISDDASANELCYRNMHTPFGFLIRDVRQVGDLDGQDLMGKWEVAVLHGVEPSALTCWLNMYSSDGSPAHAKLVVIINGQQSVQEFDVNCHGDNAQHAGRRETSNAWKRLSIQKNEA